ncbi:MAG TPA: 3,4-dehydroadipyl-CoA semialdehyde dehydrogenase [Kofleriaceae bacterium]|nr:3,4-dehydroadipyl-CoA semialdehyde dehydrogenase [Kofleriaceae bacterium]
MKKLASYIGGAWVQGQGPTTTLFNPTTEEPIAETSSAGIDFAAGLDHARQVGAPALRALGFRGRGELLRQLAKAIHGGREELIALAIANGGNTRGDAKFDIDGAAATLAAYADLAETLGQGNVIADGDGVQVGRTARLFGQHVLTPRAGVAVHINAFNFPAWGLAEKAAAALLAGMPVVSKPATATALVAHRLVEMVVEHGLLPAGALTLICGGAGDLLDHLQGQDVLAFTGSSETAQKLRASAGVVARSVRINVEADSLNAAVLGPDVSPGSDTEALFVRDVVRDMTQKAGQKCTAIRRVFVPEARLGELAERLAAELGAIVVGNPAESNVRMGPLATAAQLRDVRAGIQRLAEETAGIYGGTGEIAPAGAGGKGYFLGPVLRLSKDPAAARALHEHEVFGPVATIAPYSGQPLEAAALVQRGEGGLVASIYSDDRDYFGSIIPEVSAWNGRLYLGSAKIADQSPGPGTVLPLLMHGGPGRAGGGEELGGLAGMRLYLQRTALQGDKGIIKTLL